ncbi:MAG TPA: YciI family protein [Terriglobales bacterium]
MRFLMIVKANKDSEAGKMPSQELFAAMGKYNDELRKAGALVELAGLQPSSKGFRVKFSDGKKTIVDGPFAETKELVAGFWIIDVKSREEALSWAKRIPEPFGQGQEAVVEVRPFFNLEDFASLQGD